MKEYVKHKLFRKQTHVSRSQEQSPPSGWSTREKVDCKSHHMLQTFGTKASGILLNFQKKREEKKNFFQHLLFLLSCKPYSFSSCLEAAFPYKSSPGKSDSIRSAQLPPTPVGFCSTSSRRLSHQSLPMGSSMGREPGESSKLRHNTAGFFPTSQEKGCPRDGRPCPSWLPRLLCIRGQCRNSERPVLCFGASRRLAADA